MQALYEVKATEDEVFNDYELQSVLTHAIHIFLQLVKGLIIYSHKTTQLPCDCPKDPGQSED